MTRERAFQNQVSWEQPNPGGLLGGEPHERASKTNLAKETASDHSTAERFALSKAETSYVHKAQVQQCHRGDWGGTSYVL